MNNLYKQMEELIKERNDFETENIKLKAEVKLVGVAALRELADARCPASGYIIENEESRKQILVWANFVEKWNAE